MNGEVSGNQKTYFDHQNTYFYIIGTGMQDL